MRIPEPRSRDLVPGCTVGLRYGKHAISVWCTSHAEWHPVVRGLVVKVAPVVKK